MKTKNILLLVALATLLTSCGLPLGKIAQWKEPGKYSTTISQYKPSHQGGAKVLQLGVYRIQSYQRSMIFDATTSLVRISQVEVFDLDSDSVFDVVFVLEQGVWSLGMTPEFRRKNKTFDLSLSASETRRWINRANAVKKSLAPRPQIISKRHISPRPKQTDRSHDKPSISQPKREKFPESIEWVSPFPPDSRSIPRWEPAY